MGRYILFLYLLFLSEIVTSCRSHCDVVEGVKEININGVVSKKYRLDWNHNSPEIDFTNSANNDHVKYRVGENVHNIYLVFEKSGFWKYVQEGDSIVKKRDSFEIVVYRNEILARKFILDYGCK